MNDTLEGAIRAYTTERAFHADTCERWLSLAADDAGALWELTQELRLGENQLRDLWQWAEEIAARDRTTLAAVLTGAAVRAARQRPGGRSERLKASKAALRRLRFPGLAKTEDRIAALIAGLDLSPTVRLSVPDFLEGDELRAEIVARDAAGLAAAAHRLAQAAAQPACEEIFELLSEAPETSGSD